MSAVKVPADVELEDKLAFGLTARQLALLAGSGVCAYGAYLLLTPLVPAPVALAAPLLVVLGGLLLALGRHDGMSGDQLALALGRYLRAPKQRLLAPDGLPAPLARRSPVPRAATLEIPVRRILRNGLVQLADGSHCLLVEARGSSFELRSQVEQTAFVDCFARFLNSRGEPVQLTVRSEPASLTPHAARLEHAAAALPRELAAAAREHAAFLRELAHESRLLRRRIVLVLGSKQREPDLAAASLGRQAAEAAQILAGAEVALRPLRGEEAAALLAASLDPPGPTAGSDLEGVIHATSQTTEEASSAT
jgi:PrgI family protein